MTDQELAQQEVEIPQMAVRALADAQQRALQSGRPLVVVMNGELVRIGPNGNTVLRKLPPRKKVTIHVKEARS